MGGVLCHNYTLAKLYVILAAILDFLYLTAMLNLENDGNVFFVPKNVKKDI